MEAQAAQFTVLKVMCLALLSFIVACGVRVRDDDAEANGPDSKNELVAITDGDVATQFSTYEAVCERSRYLTTVDFTVPEGEAAGMHVRITATGELEAGEAITPDNSTEEKDFQVLVETRDGGYYTFDSFNPPAGYTAAALTVTQASDWVTSGRLWVETLSPAAASGSRNGGGLGFRGSFRCQRWE